MEQHEGMAWMLRSFIEGESVSTNGNRLNVAAQATPAGVL